MPPTAARSARTAEGQVEMVPPARHREEGRRWPSWHGWQGGHMVRGRSALTRARQGRFRNKHNGSASNTPERSNCTSLRAISLPPGRAPLWPRPAPPSSPPSYVCGCHCGSVYLGTLERPHTFLLLHHFRATPRLCTDCTTRAQRAQLHRQMLGAAPRVRIRILCAGERCGGCCLRKAGSFEQRSDKPPARVRRQRYPVRDACPSLVGVVGAAWQENQPDEDKPLRASSTGQRNRARREGNCLRATHNPEANRRL